MVNGQLSVDRSLLQQPKRKCGNGCPPLRSGCCHNPDRQATSDKPAATDHLTTDMRFDLLTIFPEFFAGPFDCGIIERARRQGIIEIVVHDLRSFTFDKHHIVDDRPFGGGDGMVLKPEPIFRAVETLLRDDQTNVEEKRTAVVLLSAQGRLFRQSRRSDSRAITDE